MKNNLFLFVFEIFAAICSRRQLRERVILIWRLVATSYARRLQSCSSSIIPPSISLLISATVIEMLRVGNPWSDRTKHRGLFLEIAVRNFKPSDI